MLQPRGVALRSRAECTVGDRCERAGRVLLGQGGFYCSFATAAETLAQLRKCLVLENKNEEQVDAVQGVQHAGKSIQPVVASDPRDELKHPDDAHDDRKLDIQVEPTRKGQRKRKLSAMHGHRVEVAAVNALCMDFRGNLS